MKGFYSPIDRLMEQSTRPKGTGAEYMTELSKQPGFKQAEVEDRDLQTLQALPKMAREQFMAHLKAKPATMPKERVFRNDPKDLTYEEDYDKQYHGVTGEPYHEEHTLPGGTNYREILLQHPKGSFPGVAGHFGGAPDVLASIRAKDRVGPNGEKILHIEEIQSDWHKQGSKKGYQPKGVDLNKEADKAKMQHTLLSQKLNEARQSSDAIDRNLASDQPIYQNPEVRERQKQAQIRHNESIMDLMPQVMKAQEAHRVALETARSAVPEAPFKKNWHELALKRMIHHAAEKGYHQIHITPGETQAERWGAEGKKAKGFHDLYDEQLPQFLNKFGKQYGSRVQPGQVAAGDKAPGYGLPSSEEFEQNRQPGETMLPYIERMKNTPNMAPTHRFDITPQMREDVLKNGMPLYSEGGEVEKLQDTARQGEAYQDQEKYLQTRDAVPDVKITSNLPEGTNGMFSSTNLPVGSGTVKINKNTPKQALPSVLTHEMAHAADRQMMQQAIEQGMFGKGNQFTEGYEKLVGSEGRNRTELARRLNPEWESDNRLYRATPQEIAAHGIGAFSGPNLQDRAPKHVDATAATEFQILLDLAQRNADAGPKGLSKIPAFFRKLGGYSEGGEVDREEGLRKFLEPSAEKRRMYHGTRHHPRGADETYSMGDVMDFHGMTEDQWGKAKNRDALMKQYEAHRKDSMDMDKLRSKGGFASITHGLREMSFVTPDTEFANDYAGDNKQADKMSGAVYPVHVQVKNPFDYENPSHVRAVAKLLKPTDNKWAMHYGKSPEQILNRLSSGAWEYIEDPDVQAAAKKLGHDAMYMTEHGVKNLGVFNPNAIKSATGNRGTYDINDPHMNHAEGGSIEGNVPRETVKAYKLFRVHHKHPGKLFPLFIGKHEPVEMNKWVPAEHIPTKGFAERPGWHAGDLPMATHIGEKSDTSLTAPDRRPRNQVWTEIEMPNDVDWQTEANKRGTNPHGRVIPVKAHITDQVPTGGHYRYKTNPNMTGSWLIGGAMKVNRILPDEEVTAINRAAKQADLPRHEPFNPKEFGFAKGGAVKPVAHGIIKERVTVSPNMDAMRYELMSAKHFTKKVK